MTNVSTPTAFAFTIDTTADDIAAAYAAADVRGKAAMRTGMADAIKTALMSGDIALATHLAAMPELKAAPKSSGPSVDYVAKVRDMRATLVAALARIDAGEVILPDGVSVDFTDADLTGGTADPKSVDRMVTVSGRKSGRGSVADYIDSVLADDRPMTIAELRAAHVPSDDYPTAPPSAGAIGACLDRDADDRFSAVDIDGKKGAVRN